MTTQQTLSLADIAIQQLSGSRGYLLGLLETLSDDHMTARAAGVGNHAAWVMGHLAYADDLFVSAFRDEPGTVPTGYAEQFGPGTVVSNNASDYPGRAELLAQLASTRDRTLEWTKTLDGDAAWQAAPEAIASVAPNAIAAAHTLSQHEFLHAGQLTTIRASLAMKPVFM